MSKNLVWYGVAALMVGLAGCGKPNCDKSVAHAYSILEADAAKMPEEQKKAVLAALPAQKAEALADCKAGKPRPLTKEREKCILAAKTTADLEKCAK